MMRFGGPAQQYLIGTLRGTKEEGYHEIKVVSKQKERRCATEGEWMNDDPFLENLLCLAVLLSRSRLAATQRRYYERGINLSKCT